MAKKQKPSYLSKNFASIFEYILCYVRNSNETFPFTLEKTTEGKKWPINNAGNSRCKITFPAGRVSFNMPDITIKAQNMSENNIVTILENDVVIEDGKNKNSFTLLGEWRYSQEKLNEIFDSDDVIYIAKVPFRPNHIKAGGEIKKMKNFLAKEQLAKDAYNCETNEDGTEELSKIGVEFDNPKPTGLLERLIKATSYEKGNSTILDFFAGSGTTGQAVLDLNLQDNGNRQFIVCQLNENLDQSLEQASENTKKTIENQIKLCDTIKRPHELSEITAERLRRVMLGESLDGTKDFPWLEDHTPYGGNLDVYEITNVANFASEPGQTPFDVIDETLYGEKKFTTVKEKIDWVCRNFDKTQKYLED